jgi:hypothetical protein
VLGAGMGEEGRGHGHTGTPPLLIVRTSLP